MKKILFITQLLITTSLINAQNFNFEDYTWEEESKPYQATEAEKELPEIELKDKRVIELNIEDDGSALLYNLSHYIKFLNSKEAIERNNKIYLPISYSENVITQIARVTNPDGKVVELDKNDILEAEDEESGRKYKYFALEGLELGSTMEYIIITSYPPSLTGSTYTFQNEYLKKDVAIDFYYPNHLIFEYKSYNGFPEVEEDTTTEDYNHYFAKVDSIAPLTEEAYQNYNANKQKLSFKLTGNVASGSYNLNSFKSFGDNIYEVLYADITKKEQKIIDNYLSAAKVADAKNEEEKIRRIEDYIKENIVFLDEGQNLPRYIQEVDDNKYTGEVGILILYANMFRTADIKNEFVSTSNRFTTLFDKDFENMNHLSEFAFYFPKHKSYLAPTQIFHRYPLIPYQWTENYGFFIKTISVGDVKLNSGKTKYIEPTDMSLSIDTMDIELDFSNGIDQTVFHYKRTYLGHDAVFNQSLFSYVTSEEDKEDIREEYAKQIDESMEINNLKSINEGAEFLNKKPYILTFDFTTESFIEKAGNNYLLKIGDLIGAQSEMYDNKDRKTDIEFSFAKMYIRKISFKTPEGYTLKNLESTAKDIAYKDEDGNDMMGFKTTFSEKDGVITIENKEYYNKIRIPADPYYESFREVVNAAADFNKIVLVLEKQ